MFEKIKELLKEEMVNLSERYGEKKSYIHIDEVLAIIDEVAADINVGRKNGWIPCSERLPKGRETYKVLVTDKDGIMAVCYFLEVTEAFKVCWDGEEFCGGIAWQPLPEQYKEKK
jgi:hypothetical protein